MVTGRARTLLFLTSNGTGLGHLTRSMAIARRLGDEVEPLFLTLSAAAPVVEAMGLPVEYVASYTTPASGNDYRWSRRLRARLRAAIAEADPAVVIFDGTHPYEALLGALPADGVAVWCRRPLWRAGSSRVPLGRAGAFDAVLEPGELAASEDRGPTVALRDRAHRVEPIVLLDRSQLLDRERAEADLGLEPGRTNVLVALGQGEEVSAANARCLRRLAGRDDVQVAALSSALTESGEAPEGVVELRATYPISRYFAAFDAAVAAAGYNAFHELIALGVPSLFVPMPRDTDDQPARARWAASAGVGLAAAGPADPGLEVALDRLLEPDERTAIAARLAALPAPTGAAAAAAWLTDLATTPAAGAPGQAQAAAERGIVHPERAQSPSGPRSTASGRSDTRARSAPGGRSTALGPPPTRSGRRDFRRRWGAFFASAPQTALRLTRQQLTEPRARIVIAAIGLTEADAPAAVETALAEAGEAPARTLVITDALGALGAIRALGVGVEHVPGPGSRQVQLAEIPYEEFLRRRLALIRAERPRPRRVLVAPGAPPLP